MRKGRFGALVLVGATVAGVVSATYAPALAEGGKRGRVETAEYETGTHGTGVGPSGVIAAEVTFPAGSERYVSVSIEDASGAPVVARIIQQDERGTFCTSTTSPVMIDPSYDVTVRLYEGRCLDGTPSVVTTGTVEATFIDAPPVTGKTRKDVQPYSATAPTTTGKDGENVYVTAVTFTVGPGERRARFAIEDATGLPVLGKVETGVGGFPSDAGTSFCGTSPGLRVSPGQRLTVFVYEGRCDDSTASLATNGVVEGRFTRR